MKNRSSVVLAIALATVAWLQAHAVVTEVEVDIQPKVSSAFVWRGQILNDEWCFQPFVVFQGSNFALSAWGNWDLTSVSNATRNTRVDVTLDYSTMVRSQLLSAGLVAYIYRDSPSVGPDDTFEVYVSDAVDVLLLPSLTLYYDFSDIKGFYGTFSLAHSFELVEETLNLDFKVSLGAGDSKHNEATFGYLEDPAAPELFDADQASLTDLSAAVSLPLCPREGLLIIPAIKYMTVLDSDLSDALERADEDTDIFYYSLAVGYSF